MCRTDQPGEALSGAAPDHAVQPQPSFSMPAVSICPDIKLASDTDLETDPRGLGDRSRQRRDAQISAGDRTGQKQYGTVGHTSSQPPLECENSQMAAASSDWDVVDYDLYDKNHQ
jgi:hypothetical protein